MRQEAVIFTAMTSSDPCYWVRFVKSSVNYFYADPIFTQDMIRSWWWITRLIPFSLNWTQFVLMSLNIIQVTQNTTISTISVAGIWPITWLDDNFCRMGITLSITLSFKILGIKISLSKSCFENYKLRKLQCIHMARATSTVAERLTLVKMQGFISLRYQKKIFHGPENWIN